VLVTDPTADESAIERSSPIASLIALPLVLLFVWSMFTGFHLWRGHNSGRKWATILFAMQIPILTVPGFSYEYYTGLSVKVIGGHVDNPVSFSLGSKWQSPGVRSTSH